jgi:prefoldin subunit 5
VADYFKRLYSCRAWLRRAAYKEETRTTILTLDRVSKRAPNGKQILKDIGLGIYLGAKIGHDHNQILL